MQVKGRLERKGLGITNTGVELIFTLLVLMLLTEVCQIQAAVAVAKPSSALTPATGSEVELIKITDMEIRELEEVSQLVITSDSHLKYTVTKGAAKNQVVLNIPQAVLMGPPLELTSSEGDIVSVTNTVIKVPAEVKVVVQLTQAMAYQVFQTDTQLFFAVKKEEKSKSDLGFEALPSEVVPLSPQATQKKLKKLVSLDVTSGEATGVLTGLAAEAGLGITINKSIQGLLITVKADKVTVLEALGMVVGQITGNYDFDVQRGMIYVGMAQDLAAQKALLPQSTEVLTIQNADVSTLQGQLSTVLKTGVGKLTADTTNNNIILKGTDDDLEVIKETMVDLGALAIPIKKGSVQSATSGQATQKKASQNSEPSGTIVTRVFTLNFPSTDPVLTGGAAQDWNVTNLQRIADILKGSVMSKGSNGKVVIDPRTNSLVVTDIVDNMPAIESLIKQLDIPLKQVMIEAMLVEVSLNKETDLGINWKLTNGPQGNLQTANPTTAFLSNNSIASNAMTSYLNIGSIQDTHALSTQLAAMESVGTANILSTPKIAALDRTLANFTIQDTIPYLGVPTTTSTGNPPETITTQTVNFLNLPISLSIQPEIGNDDKTVTLHPLTVNVVSQTGAAIANGPPPTNSRAVTSVVAVQDGQTIVIGGMIKDQDQKQEYKIPVLGDIPLLGMLFKGSSVTKEKIELLIFLTPHIIK